MSLSGNNMKGYTTQSRKGKKINALLRELSDDDDNTVDIGVDILSDPQRPWLQDYHAYMDVIEQVPEGWSMIKWWGVSRRDPARRSCLLCDSDYSCSTIRSAIIPPGVPWHATTLRLCRHLYRASARFHKVVSRLPSCAAVSRAT